MKPHRKPIILAAAALLLAAGLTVWWQRHATTAIVAKAPVPSPASTPSNTPPPATSRPDVQPRSYSPYQPQVAVADLLRGVTPINPAVVPAGSPIASQNLEPTGILRFVGMEPGWRLGRIRADLPRDQAMRDFAFNHREAFGIANPRVDLSILRYRPMEKEGRDMARLQQTYAGLPVFAGQLVVNVANGTDVTSINADAAKEFPTLDKAPLPLAPVVNSPTAVLLAHEAMLTRNPGVTMEQPEASKAELVVYAPEVVGLSGQPELAWAVTVATAPDVMGGAAAQWILSAEDGAVLNCFDKSCSALVRRVYDYNSMTTGPSTPTRNDGEAAVGITEVDNAYDFMGQVYNFYNTTHGRDSYNGIGSSVRANVRVCDSTCPWANANSGTGTSPMSFGAGYVADDVVAHEFTHKVVEFESGLLYQNASGAMNESLADIWGELFDQSNSSLTPGGTDTTANRWILGEDVASGALRNMSNPPAFNNPDRTGSALYQQSVTYPRGDQSNNNDNGGVHSNSGVNNKLCWLLVDGGTFNGWGVGAIGSNPTLRLYYEANANLLTPGSDWRDLWFILDQAAINLGYGPNTRGSIEFASRAVEIDVFSHTVHIDRGTNAANKIGIPEVSGIYGPYTSLSIALNASAPNGTIKIQGAGGDVTVNPGTVISQKVILTTYDPFTAPTGGTPTAPTPAVIRTP